MGGSLRALKCVSFSIQGRQWGLPFFFGVTQKMVRHWVIESVSLKNMDDILLGNRALRVLSVCSGFSLNLLLH